MTKYSPGAADRILIMAENQASHRQKLEAKVISSDVKNSKIGLFLGFVIALVALAVGCYLAINGMPWPGSLLSFGSIGSLVGIFVYGSRQRRQERAEKRSK